MPRLLSAPSPCLLPLPLYSFLLFFLKNVHGSKIWRQNQKTPTSPRFVPKWTLVSRKKNSNKIFLFCSLPSIYLWIQVTHQTHRSLGVFGWAQAPPLFQGYMQNQMPAVTKGTLTFDFENALMLLTYFKGQGWGHTRHMLTTSCDLLPSRELSRAVLQTETYIFFFLWRQSLLQTAWLIHLHYLILWFFFFFFISEKSYSQLVFMSTTAGSLWNLQAIQSMCQMEQDKVSDGRKNTCTGCLFSVCCNLWCLAERMPDKKQAMQQVSPEGFQNISPTWQYRDDPTCQLQIKQE